MTKAETVRSLLDAHGTTFCDELGIKIEKNQPQPLFRWLVAAILYANPIQHELAAQASRALAREGLRGPKQVAEATWERRADVLGRNGYSRYDERTATILKDAADHVLEAYKGDLRRLRAAAGHDPGEARKRLKAVKGMGDVAVDIFFREVQGVWEEIYPFADKLALRAAERRKLGADAASLAKLVDRGDFPRLVAALTRDELGEEPQH